MTESSSLTVVEPAADPVPGQRLGAVALHPVLLAMHPALALWSANVDEVLPGEVWPALWVPAAIASAAWVLGTMALGTARRGAVAASTLITVALWAGRLWFAPSLPVIAGLAVVAAVAVGTAVRNWSIPTGLGVTAVVNVMSLVLVAFTLPNIVSAEWARRNVVVPDGIDVAIPEGTEAGQQGPPPDIFYIIPDRYPREDSLAEFFDYDNSAWVDALEERGFQVADRSVANYPSTGMSLASTWNLAPLDLLVTPPENPKDWAPTYALLRDHALGRNLVRAGYDYIHMGTWWSPTSVAASATQNLRLDGTSEFVAVFQQQLGERGGTAQDEDGSGLGDLKWYERSPLHTLFQWQELRRLADEQYEPRDKPRFVLAHITVPHEPYVFEADGSPVSQETAWSRTREDNFIRQVQYVNNEIDDVLDRLLAGPRDQWPVIVIQSDEGPHPAGKKDSSYDWLEVSVEERREKLQIFSAILLPDRYDLVLPEDLRSINTWRLLLDELLGTGLGTVDAPVYVYSPEAIYDVVDVTDEITGG